MFGANVYSGGVYLGCSQFTRCRFWRLDGVSMEHISETGLVHFILCCHLVYLDSSKQDHLWRSKEWMGGSCIPNKIETGFLGVRPVWRIYFFSWFYHWQYESGKIMVRYNGKTRKKEILIPDHNRKLIWWVYNEYVADLQIGMSLVQGVGGECLPHSSSSPLYMLPIPVPDPEHGGFFFLSSFPAST